MLIGVVPIPILPLSIIERFVVEYLIMTIPEPPLVPAVRSQSPPPPPPPKPSVPLPPFALFALAPIPPPPNGTV